MAPALCVEGMEDAKQHGCIMEAAPLDLGLVSQRAERATAGVQRLVCTSQCYQWGRSWDRSEVAQLSLAAGQQLDRSKPYAELWMGTHPSAPSRLADGKSQYTGQPLLVLLRDHPEMLGNAAQEFGVDLPFLLKVLSVETALSIQSHPDKRLAERLHAERPKEYKDANHKPEMAVALSDFEALCSFAPHNELAAALNSVPELAVLCGSDVVAAYLGCSGDERRQHLQAAFTALMTADAATVAAAVHAMCARLEAKAASGQALSDKEALVLRLQAQYPADVGVMAAWFLNYLRLGPGQAIALAANEPHAYISGEIVEIMATSDNVLRAGLTPKFRDTKVLCASLTYSQGPPDVMAGERCTSSPHLALYRPALDSFREFELWRLAAPGKDVTELQPARGPVLVLVQHGTARLRAAAAGGGGRQELEVARGDVLFVPAGVALEVHMHEAVTMWMGACRGMGPEAAAATC